MYSFLLVHCHFLKLQLKVLRELFPMKLIQVYLAQIGQYAERYGAQAPWRARWDVKFLQDYKVKISENKTNTIQLSIDVLNIGNLISSEWGLVQQPNNVSQIGLNVDLATLEPTYSFNPNQTQTFGYDSSLASRWQIQFGLRYIF